MNIIISPAKKMNEVSDDLPWLSIPSQMNKTIKIYSKLRDMDFTTMKNLFACNTKIAELNYRRYNNMNIDCIDNTDIITLNHQLSAAILSYEGIQYKYMSPGTFNQDEFDYIQKHLKILSGFYGILRPFDGIVPYRLEMQTKLSVDDSKNLYDFWGDSIYKEITKDSNVILNLASKEYSKIIKDHLKNDVLFISCTFGTLYDNKIKTKATEAKIARGLMVSYMAKNNIKNIEDIKSFNEMGFKYSEEHSCETEYVFVKCKM